MQYLEQTIKFYEITPAQANRWLENCNFDNQRNLRTWWIDYLAKEMLAGRFESVANITFVTCKENGVFYNINGHHTLHAIIKSGITISLPVSEFVVENEGRVQELFTRIDKNLKRTVKDSIKILGLDSRLNLNKTTISKIFAAVKLIGARLCEGGNTMRNYTENELLDACELFINEYELFTSAIKGDIKQKYERGIKLAMILLTFKFNSKLANEFWRKVASGDGKFESPERVLFDYFHYETKVKSSYEVRDTIAYCWNQYYNKEKAKINKDTLYNIFSDGLFLEGIDIDFDTTTWEKQFFKEA